MTTTENKMSELCSLFFINFKGGPVSAETINIAIEVGVSKDNSMLLPQQYAIVFKLSAAIPQ